MPVNSLNGEVMLRNNLFIGYNKYVRPIRNYSDSLEVNIGLAVQDIEYFDQIKETGIIIIPYRGIISTKKVNATKK